MRQWIRKCFFVEVIERLSKGSKSVFESGFLIEVFSNDWFYFNYDIGKCKLIGAFEFHLGESIQEWTKSNILKAAFHKFYLVHSWILCLICFCLIYTASHEDILSEI